MPIRKQRKLFIVDPQIDFCADHTHPAASLLPHILFDIPNFGADPSGKTPWRPKQGALFVGGAMEDTHRLAAHILDDLKEYDDIFVTQDCHQEIHVAHPMFWKDAHGNPPGPFTQIKLADLKAGTWQPYLPGLMPVALNYLEKLEANKRFDLTIWPPHCLAGTIGCAFMPEISAALSEWERKEYGRVNIVLKGNNPYTEHYSGLQADVPDDGDPTTKLNTDIIKALEDDAVGLVRFAGQALSHCVANTMRDVIENFGSGSASKIELIGNCTSPVFGFQQQADDFLNWFTGKGGKVIKV